MGKNYARVKRGQVYWFDPLNTYGGYDTYIAFNKKEYPTSIQLNNRPWLVVSNDTGNSSSPTCNIVPITLEDKADIPVHVQYTFEGKTQTILCEQMRTVDCLALRDYAYTVSDDIMRKVEEALLIQYSIRPIVSYMDMTMQDTLKHLENVIGSIISSKVEMIKKEMESKQTPAGVLPQSEVESTALKLGEMIEDLVKDVKVDREDTTDATDSMIPVVLTPAKDTVTTSTTSKVSRDMSQVEKFEARYGKAVVKKPSTPATETKKENNKSARNKWTIESRQQYLVDCETMSPSAVMWKYNFSTLQSVFTTKYLHRNYLINQGIIKE